MTVTRERLRKAVTAKAELNAEERVIDALIGTNASQETRDSPAGCCAKAGSPTRRSSSRSPTGPATALPTFDIPGMPGAQMGMLNLGDIFGKAFGERMKRKRMTVAESYARC